MSSVDVIHELVRQHPRLVVAEDYELVVQRSQSETHHYRNGRETKRESDSRFWISLRLIHRKQPGRAVTSWSDTEALQSLVNQAFDSSERSKPDPWFRFPLWKASEPQDFVQSTDMAPMESLFDSIASPPDLVDEAYEQWQTETRIFRKTEKIQLRQRSNLNALRFVLAQESAGESFRAVEDRAASVPLEAREVWLKNLAKEVSRQPQSASGPTSGHANFIFTPKAMAPVLRRLARWFCADQVRAAKSPLAMQRGELLGSAALSLYDDGRFPGGVHSALFDLEGSQTQCTALVEKGRFSGLLYDAYTGTRENRLSTGNWLRAPRSPFAALEHSHFHVAPSSIPPSDLYGNLTHGIVIDNLDVVGGLTHDNVELILVGSGWAVQGGQRSPVRNVRIRCDARMWLRSIASVASDFESFGDCGSPSIFFENLPIGG